MAEAPAKRDSGGPLRLLHAGSEAAPFAKTGGLADVLGALPRELARRGHACAVIMPLYGACQRAGQPIEPTGRRFRIALGHKTVEAAIWQGRLPDSDVPVYFIEQSGYFQRDNAEGRGGIYQYRTPAGQLADYSDNGERFIFFNRAVLEAIRLLDLEPDILHVHDWHAGLLPAYVHAGSVADARRQSIRTVFTIHNLAYQGNLAKDHMPLTGLGWEYFTPDRLEFHDRLSLMKAGIVFADAVNTVSPRYAQEIQTPEFGHDLDGVLRRHSRKLSGIVNGVDYREWDPASDPWIPAKYDPDTLLAGKPLNKAELQRRLGLLPIPSTPVIGMITRLTDQKGLDLVRAAAAELLRENLQLVVLGVGELRYHEFLALLTQRYPEQVRAVLEFHHPLSHLIEAGVDLFLMPSRFEPCGLNQLYSLRYGTVPVVRETGGLADTVTDATPATLDARTATGFSFREYSPSAMLRTIRRALRVFHARPGLWHQLQRTGMTQDWSWARSAEDYELLYRSILANGPR